MFFLIFWHICLYNVHCVHSIPVKVVNQDHSVRFSSHWSDQKHAKLLLEFLENIRKACINQKHAKLLLEFLETVRKACINQIMLRKCLCWDKCLRRWIEKGALVVSQREGSVHGQWTQWEQWTAFYRKLDILVSLVLWKLQESLFKGTRKMAIWVLVCHIWVL